LVSSLFIFYIKFCKYTSRLEVTGQQNLDKIGVLPTGVLFCAWHGHILVTPLVKFPDRVKYGLISDNRDGDIIARTLKAFEITAIRGSSKNVRKNNKNKGGAEAAAEVRRVLKEGAFVGITPDGPRGPLHKAQPGIAALSIATQVPVLPISLSSKNCIQLKSWDLFLLPLPFSKNRVTISEPIYPPNKQNISVLHEYREKIEHVLNAYVA